MNGNGKLARDRLGKVVRGSSRLLVDETRQHSIGSDAARHFWCERWPTAASLSIEPFEASRWRMRRTRQQTVCTFKRVLVLPWHKLRGETAASSVGQKGERSDKHRLLAYSRKACVGRGMVWTHVGHPGAPARVVGQEKGVLRNCPVQVAGRATDVAVRAARPPRRF
jgi:hypothetical protein